MYKPDLHVPLVVTKPAKAAGRAGHEIVAYVLNRALPVYLVVTVLQWFTGHINTDTANLAFGAAAAGWATINFANKGDL